MRSWMLPTTPCGVRVRRQRRRRERYAVCEGRLAFPSDGAPDDEMALAAAERVRCFFNTTDTKTVFDGRIIALDTYVKKNYTLNIFWHVRQHAAVLDDIFVQGALAKLTEAEKHIIVRRLASRQADPAVYGGVGIPYGHGLLDGLREAAILAVVKEQLGDLPLAWGSFKRSPLWDAYASVRARAGPALHAAVVRLCAADRACGPGGGVLVVGPSTLVGAGLGAFALGTVRRGTSIPYGGLLVSEEDIRGEEQYMMAVGGPFYVDGSRVATVASVVNEATAGRRPNVEFVCSAERDVGRRTVTGVVVEDVTSAELLADYAAAGH